ncbi:cellulose biosynthesis cyclic di-GMP-binding regulatory protein BcsB [Inquilinus sp. YAF38]|uniref:cellulose biosynthesis cyclic di-GMP-binding regulatory protein BcsB n=1 Tax=Inquilinus sp. YAF38 TaxID=3233084 RepID=UPI003F8F6EEB
MPHARRSPASRRSGWLAAVAVLGIAAAAPAQQIPLPGAEPSPPPAPVAPRPAPGSSERIPVPGLQQTSPPPSPERQVNPPAAGQQPAQAPVSAPAPSPAASPPPAAPATATPAAPSAPAGPAPNIQAEAPAPAAEVPDIRLPLVAVEGTSGLRLSGERVAARFALIAPPLGSGDGATLSLSHLSGADLLPERSRLDVSLNGKPIGALEPDAFATPGATDLAIPPGLLQPGRNLLTISGRQTHRVLCGPGAGFDLWTQLDPDRSGVTVPAKDLGPVSDIGGFIDAAAAASARGEAIPVSLRVPLTPETIGTLVSVATLLGRAMPELSPSFDVALGGTDAVGRPRIVVAGGSDAASVRPAADGAPVLLLQGAPRDLLTRLWADATPLAGSSRPHLIERGQRVTLTELGLGDLPVTEQRRQVDAVIRLPSDFLVSNDSVARLRLMLAYDGGLPPGAGMTLSLNGTALAMRPFGHGGGEVIENEEYQLPLRLFHAGDNTVRFDFSVPAQVPQQACPEVGGNRPFATLFGDTSLTFDDAPHMVALPDLSLTAATGYPYAGSGPARLFLSDLDPRTVAAALTVAARLSAASDTPVRFEPTLSLAGPPAPTLVVGPVATLPSGLFVDSPISPAEIAPHLAQDFAGSTLPAVPPAGPVPDAGPSAGSADARLAWQVQLDQRATSRDTIADQASSLWDDVLQDARRLVGWHEAGPSVPDWLAAQKIQAAGFVGQWQGAPGLVTLVTAADPQALSAFAVRTARPAAWSALDGDAALLLADGWSLHQPVEQSLVMTKPFLSANMLMVAGHWFSRNGTLWTIAVLVLSVVAAGVTRALLGRIGVRPKR